MNECTTGHNGDCNVIVYVTCPCWQMVIILISRLIGVRYRRCYFCTTVTQVIAVFVTASMALGILAVTTTLLVQIQPRTVSTQDP